MCFVLLCSSPGYCPGLIQPKEMFCAFDDKMIRFTAININIKYLRDYECLMLNFLLNLAVLLGWEKVFKLNDIFGSPKKHLKFMYVQKNASKVQACWFCGTWNDLNEFESFKVNWMNWKKLNDLNELNELKELNELNEFNKLNELNELNELKDTDYVV